jgi:hypothetical protein
MVEMQIHTEVFFSRRGIMTSSYCSFSMKAASSQTTISADCPRMLRAGQSLRLVGVTPLYTRAMTTSPQPLSREDLMVAMRHKIKAGPDAIIEKGLWLNTDRVHYLREIAKIREELASFEAVLKATYAVLPPPGPMPSIADTKATFKALLTQASNHYVTLCQLAVLDPARYLPELPKARSDIEDYVRALHELEIV